MNKEKEMKDQILKNIEEFNWHVTGVFAGEDTPPFCYSIGMQKLDMPEIVIAGMNIKNAGTIINFIGHLMMDGDKFEVGKTYNNIINVPVQFVELSKETIENNLFGAVNIFKNSDFNALQMIWSDGEGNFPWDDDFKEEFQDYQTLMS